MLSYVLYHLTDDEKPDPVGTMGLLIDTDHPALAGFAGEKYSTPQWWEIVQNSRSVILDDFKGEKNVIVRTIDNFDRNHNLSLLYEYEKDGGKVVVCSCDFDKLSHSPEGRAFIKSVVDYVKTNRIFIAKGCTVLRNSPYFVCACCIKRPQNICLI